MKISDVTLELFTWNSSGENESLTVGNKVTDPPQLGLLRVITDEGVEGHAFLGSPLHSADTDALSLVRFLKPLLVGRDPFDREHIFRQMWSWQRRRFTTLRAIGAIDVALWDLAGKVAQLPIYKLIGKYRDRIPAYASSKVFSSIGAYVDDIHKMREQGYQAYKIHPFQGTEQDIAVCEAVRKAADDKYPLMLDSMWAYNYPQALRVGQAIDEMGFHWYEDPLRENDIYNYVKLCAKLSVPIMATEFVEGSLDLHTPWMVERATDFLRGDVAVKGGITAMLKMAHLAEAFNLNFEVHDALNSLANVANLHVALSIPNTEYFEVLLLPSLTEQFGLVGGLKIDADGFVHAPQGPGLGVEIDFDLIRRNSVAILR